MKNNQIKVINPYLWNGMWVFDDAEVGLSKEPLVAGADTLLDALCSAKSIIPEHGCVVMFSGSQFPNHDARLVWGSGDRKNETKQGNTYVDAASGHEAWLCPALFLYFNEAPKELYVQVLPKQKTRK